MQKEGAAKRFGNAAPFKNMFISADSVRFSDSADFADCYSADYSAAGYSDYSAYSDSS